MGLLKSKLIVLAKERNNLIAPHTPISHKLIKVNFNAPSSIYFWINENWEIDLLNRYLKFI